MLDLWSFSAVWHNSLLRIIMCCVMYYILSWKIINYKLDGMRGSRAADDSSRRSDNNRYAAAAGRRNDGPPKDRYEQSSMGRGGQGRGGSQGHGGPGRHNDRAQEDGGVKKDKVSRSIDSMPKLESHSKQV